MSPWLMVLPVGGLGWWMLGFPPGWGWLVLPMIPPMPVSSLDQHWNTERPASPRHYSRSSITLRL